MKGITKAIKGEHPQIRKLRADMEIRQRAASCLAGGRSTTAEASPDQLKTTRKQRKMSAAAKKAVSKRMKAYWAKRKRATR